MQPELFPYDPRLTTNYTTSMRSSVSYFKITDYFMFGYYVLNKEQKKYTCFCASMYWYFIPTCKCIFSYIILYFLQLWSMNSTTCGIHPQDKGQICKIFFSLFPFRSGDEKKEKHWGNVTQNEKKIHGKIFSLNLWSQNDDFNICHWKQNLGIEIKFGLGKRNTSIEILVL